MHLYDTIKGENGRQFCEQTLKLDPAEFDLDAVNRVEVYGTDLSDPGEDYCEFRGAGSNRAKNYCSVFHARPPLGKSPLSNSWGSTSLN